MGGVSFMEAEAFGAEADGGFKGGRGGGGEAEEGDGGMDGGDAADVVVDGGVVEKAGGEEDGDGETVRLDELGKFNHCYDVPYACGWKHYYCFFHFSSFSVCVSNPSLHGFYILIYFNFLFQF